MSESSGRRFQSIFLRMRASSSGERVVSTVSIATFDSEG
jgi:hypothetical protein